MFGAFSSCDWPTHKQTLTATERYVLPIKDHLLQAKVYSMCKNGVGYFCCSLMKNTLHKLSIKDSLPYLFNFANFGSIQFLITIISCFPLLNGNAERSLNIIGMDTKHKLNINPRNI